jgi:hypothetical protein
MVSLASVVLVCVCVPRCANIRHHCHLYVISDMLPSYRYPYHDVYCMPLFLPKANIPMLQVCALQVEQKNQEHDLIINEFERVKQHNMRLEITCKDYQEKLLASEAIMNNYKAIQEENRRLYNQVQDLRGNIRVFCR